MDSTAEPRNRGKHRDLRDLWLLRMLAHGGAALPFLKQAEPDEIAALLAGIGLRCPVPDSEDGRKALCGAIRRRLVRLEHHAPRFRHGTALAHNLPLLASELGLAGADCALLAYTAMLEADGEFKAVAEHMPACRDKAVRLALLLGVASESIRDALSPKGVLVRAGLVEVPRFRSSGIPVELADTAWASLAAHAVGNRGELLARFARLSRTGHLETRDYAHLADEISLLAALLRDAVDTRRPGVNLLLHGWPGTGKTQLSRLLAAQVSADLYEVPTESDVAGEASILRASQRLAAAARSQLLLSRSRALLLFDEIEAIFNDGSRFFGKPSTAEEGKAWVNDLLENTPVPTLWIANDISGMDAAFLRRFDMVLEVDTPPRSQRIDYLVRACDSRLDRVQIERLAHSDAVTPAVMQRALSVAQRAGGAASGFADTVERVLDGTLRAQGHRTVRESLRHGGGAPDYDPSLANADQDLARLADALAPGRSGRLCLHGPPGTGKTGFGHWLARRLDMPLVIKRASDLQGAYVGMTERNLARAFATAERDGALLQLDEADTFLRDRTRARQSWEVSQTNEFLTQLESFDGVVVCTTNFIDALDAAAMRRFDFRIGFDYLRLEQSLQLLLGAVPGLDATGCATHGLRERLRTLGALTPGDFAVARRRCALLGDGGIDAFMAALQAESSARGPRTGRIGFV